MRSRSRSSKTAPCRCGICADYTERLNRIFAKYGTTGTFYAHASVGCLHVRPVLNVKRDEDVGKLRAIAEEAFAIVREYGGAHSGEHGDGIVRSEFHAEMFGPRIVAAFGEVKRAFDPAGLLNPGKIVDAPKMDDRTLFRYGPGYAPTPLDDRARLVGVGRVHRRGRDVQQQRRVPQGDGRRDVPVVSRHRRRAPRHARPRQRAAARADRPARPRRSDVRRSSTTRSTCASRARRASASARPASTWRA